MTTEELDTIADSLRPFVVNDEARSTAAKGPSREAAHRVNIQLAQEAAHRFNVQLEPQRLLLERARANQSLGERIPENLRVELRAAAVLFRAERGRIEQRFGLRVRR